MPQERLRRFRAANGSVTASADAAQHAPYGLAASRDTTASTRARGGGGGSAEAGALERVVAPSGEAEARGAAGLRVTCGRPTLRVARQQRGSAAQRAWRWRSSEAARGEAAAVACSARMPPALRRTSRAGCCSGCVRARDGRARSCATCDVSSAAQERRRNDDDVCHSARSAGRSVGRARRGDALAHCPPRRPWPFRMSCRSCTMPH